MGSVFIAGWICGVGTLLLKEAFPGLFRIAQIKEAYVVDYVCWHNRIAHWDVLFTRLVHA